ncbi:MAG: hypothetical protein INR62_10950 [Rhodospirillales bacterium]|nr:hypothetical protein [Acetobacter sp.]
MLHVVSRPTGPGELIDTANHLASACGAAEQTLVLIRPGGYVALISDAGDLSIVFEYLVTIGRASFL